MAASQERFGPHYRVNVRFVIGSLLAGAAIAIAVVAWVRFQYAANARAFLAKASDLEDQGRWIDAARALDRYLKITPSDAEARARLARTFERGAKSPKQFAQATELYAAAIAANPDEPSLRVRRAQLLLAAGRYSEALEAAQNDLLGSAASQTDLHVIGSRVSGLARLELAAQSSSASNDMLRSAFQDLTRALHGEPDDIEVARHLVRLLDTKALEIELPSVAEGHRRAQKLVFEFVRNNPDSAAAFLLRYRRRLEWDAPSNGALPQYIDADLDRALELAPTQVAVLREATLRSVRRKNWAAAAEFADKLVDAAPDQADSYLLKADVEFRRAAPDSAIATLLHAASLLKTQENVLARLMEALADAERFDEAQEHLARLERVVLRAPSDSDQQPRLALEYYKASRELSEERPLTAIRRLRAALALASNSGRLVIKSRRLLGTCYASAGLWDLAASQFGALFNGDREERADDRIEAAKAWIAAGQPKRAITLLETDGDLGRAPEQRAMLASALLSVWERTGEQGALERASEVVSSATARTRALSFLAAEVASAKQNHDAAVKALIDLRNGKTVMSAGVGWSPRRVVLGSRRWRETW